MGVIVVTGAGGLLGREVTRVLDGRGEEVIALGHGDLDVSDEAAVRDAIVSIRPSSIVHCAAVTNVDVCEEDPDRAFAVNARGSGFVASAADRVGAEVVAISTDYVFDGTKGSAYVESDATSPVQTYGRAKLEGEERVRSACRRHYIVRSAWIYGRDGKNFLSKIPDMASGGAPITAVTDQRSSPTYAPDLADALASLAGSGAYGIYHVVNAGSCSFVEFCRYALGVLGSDAPVQEVTRADLGRPAPRPADTSLVSETWTRAGFGALRAWTQAAEDFCARATLP